MTAKEANIQIELTKKKMQDSMFADIDFSDFSIFIFKVNHIFMEKKDNPVEKVVTDEEEPDGIEIDLEWCSSITNVGI